MPLVKRRRASPARFGQATEILQLAHQAIADAHREAGAIRPPRTSWTSWPARCRSPVADWPPRALRYLGERSRPLT
jgi:hypothetical protein